MQCQFVTCMNPASGSFTIDSRLQRHFCSFSVPNPNIDNLRNIYGTILSTHLAAPYNMFSKEVQSIVSNLVNISITIHKRTQYLFTPTALKFHYVFSMRDLTRIYRSLINTIGVDNTGTNVNLVNFNGTVCSKPTDLIRLYIHEAFREYQDRLLDEYDCKVFRNFLHDTFKKDFEEFDDELIFAQPLIYCHFTQPFDQKYMPINSWNSLNELLMEIQCNYNDIIGHMNLVLFKDAMTHICR